MTTPRLKGRIWKLRDLAQVVGWTVAQTRNRLMGGGALFKIGGHWYSSVDKLIECEPDAWQWLSQYVDMDDEGCLDQSVADELSEYDGDDD